MSKSKLDNWEASGVGKHLAWKAFAHLITPIELRRREVGELAYKALLQQLGLTASRIASMHEAGLLGVHPSCDLTLDGDDAKYTVRLGGLQRTLGGVVRDVYPNGEYVKSSLTCRPPPALYGRMADAYRELETPTKARDTLAQEIAAQVHGRSVAYICKRWPQAASSVLEWFGVVHENSAEMTCPFEDLIKKHLLALPAPSKP